MASLTSALAGMAVKLGSVGTVNWRSYVWHLQQVDHRVSEFLHAAQDSRSHYSHKQGDTAWCLAQPQKSHHIMTLVLEQSRWS